MSSALPVSRAVDMAIDNFLVVQDQLHPANVIHVIAGEDYRTDCAIQLYQQGYGKITFYTGNWWGKYQYFHGPHGWQRFLVAGVPDDAIAIDDSPVKSTYLVVERLRIGFGTTLTRLGQ